MGGKTIQLTSIFSKLLNPVGLIIAAFIAMAIVFHQLYTRSEMFGNQMIGLYNVFKSILSPILEFIKKQFNELKQKFIELNEATGGKLLTGLKTLGLILGVMFVGPLIGAAEAIGILLIAITGLIAGFVWLQNKTMELQNIIRGFFINLWQSIVGFFTNIGITIQNFVNWIPSAITAIINFFQMLPNYLVYAIGFMIGLIANLAVHILNFFVVDIPIYIQTLANIIAQFFTITIPNYIQQLLNWFSTLPNKAANVVNEVTNWFASLPGRLWDALKDMWSTIVNAFNDLKNNAVVSARNTVNDIVNEFAGLPGRISEAIKGAFRGAKSEASSLMSSLKSGLSAGFKLIPFQSGGVIPQTGLYMMHKGERVTPEGSHTASGEIVVNVYNYGDINESSGDLGIIGRKITRAIELSKMGIS